MGVMATTEEQGLRIQKYLDRLWKWARDNRLVFNADKCKVLHLEHRNGCRKYRLGGKWLESSTCERDFRSEMWLPDRERYYCYSVRLWCTCNWSIVFSSLSTLQEGYSQVGIGAAQGRKDGGQIAGEACKIEEAGSFQPGEEETLRGSVGDIQVCEGVSHREEGRTCSSGTKLREPRFNMDVRNCSVPEKEGSDLGDSREEVNATDNSSCAETALESPASFSKEKGNKHSHFEKEVGDKLQEFDAPGSTKWQHSEANDTVRQSENKTCDCTAPTENQECNSSSNPLTNLKALQSEHDHSFPAQSTDLPASQAKSLEDQRCEDLVTEITAKDKSLVDILMPHRVRKTVLDLMEGLFPVNISALDRTCRRKWRFQSVQENDSQQAAGSSCGTRNSLGRRAEAETLHINPALRENREDWDDPESITSKKRELISSIQLRLQALWDERTLVQSEAQEHAARSKELESVVQGLCKPNEYERYMMFIGDLEKVVSLLLCLSSRLARVQNAMGAMDENTDAEEKQSLHERHKLLSRQREDAKDLKENLDRRERVVSGILSKYMDESQLEDYRHFIQEKTSLLVEQKDLEEQIQFLEEQLERLEKSLLP
ncbi:Protein Shroom1 [Varanus komodoensis]|nr:Protein Shroom1 [Varanus komodoensis]